MSKTEQQDELKHYFKEVRKLPVMTKERENEIRQLMLDPNITSSQIAKLRDEVITSNLRFVVSVANKYQNNGLDIMDLISEGNSGLIRAFETFDWSNNLTFNTYAVHWIKQKIMESLHNDSRTIRIPVNVIQDTLRRTKNNTDPDVEIRSLDLTKSYDDYVNEDGDTFLDLISDPTQKSIDEIDDNPNTLKNLLFKTLESLEEREKDIILWYFGFKGDANITLQEIGDEYGLTKERVRQIKEKALRKIRMESKILFDYFENY